MSAWQTTEAANKAPAVDGGMTALLHIERASPARTEGASFGGYERLPTKGCPMRKIIPLVTLCLLTQGCVGIGALKTHRETFQDPTLFDTACVKGLWSTNSSQAVSNAYTAAWLKTHWGEPKSIRHAGATDLDEIWTYKFGPNWNGIVIVALVPLPIALPVGRERVQLILRDGCVISGKQTISRMVGESFGLYPGVCGFGFGAFPLSD